MSLTAARTELNIILQGADETARMLEEARQRMQQLESQLQALVSATNAQAGAAGSAGTATAGFTDRVAAAVGVVDDYRERIDGSLGKIMEYVDWFGSIGEIITQVVGAYNFLKDAMSDADEQAAYLNKVLEEQKAIGEELRASIEELANAQKAAATELRSSAQTLFAEQIKLAELQKNMDLAESLRAQQEHQAQLDYIEELNQKLEEQTEAKIANNNLISDSVNTLRENERHVAERQAEIDELLLDIAKKKLEVQTLANNDSMRDGAEIVSLLTSMAEAENRISNYKKEIYAITTNTIKPERERLELAQEANRTFLKQQSLLKNMIVIAEQVAAAMKGDGVLQMDVLDESAPAKPSGGGGGKSKAEREREKREKDFERRKILRELDEEDEVIERAKRRASDMESLGDEVLASQRQLRERILKELASLPTDATSTVFDPLRGELQKQLAELEKVTADHVAKLGFWGQPDYFDADIVNKVIDSWDAEAQGIAKVNDALTQLSETRVKASEEAEKMREAMFRAMPAEVVEAFAVGLEQLAEMQAPVFEVVQESLAGLTAQMGKFKEGQTSLGAAIVGSASAIAGSVAKKVLGVKEEAGIRALFETAMGIATAFTNPVESAGHFAAATAFGLVAGGVITSSDPRAAGGQKAPAAPAAQTRDSALGGGGGQVTNVYNLQTGIVDGQSTAHAFRRAEMTARNTGMASAGGW